MIESDIDAGTRRPLSDAELAAVLAPLGTPVAARPMSGGLFASVQEVRLADGRSVVVKTGTPDLGDRPPLLTYERDLLRSEAALLRSAAGLPGVPVAELLLMDTDRRHVEVDVMVSELLPGEGWFVVQDTMSPSATARAVRDVGTVMAGLHRVVGERFGYPAADFALGGATWPEAFGAMMAALLDDAEVWGVEVDAPLVRAAVERAGPALAEITAPHLLHMDLWPGNVLVDRLTGAVTGIVDLERGLYGDPLLEMVGADGFRVEPLDPAVVEAYLDAGGVLPLADGPEQSLTPAAERRLTVYRLYLTVLMTVEVVPRRYDHPGLADELARLVHNRAVLLDRAL